MKKCEDVNKRASGSDGSSKCRQMVGELCTVYFKGWEWILVCRNMQAIYKNATGQILWRVIIYYKSWVCQRRIASCAGCRWWHKGFGHGAFLLPLPIFPYPKRPIWHTSYASRLIERTNDELAFSIQWETGVSKSNLWENICFAHCYITFIFKRAQPLSSTRFLPVNGWPPRTQFQA